MHPHKLMKRISLILATLCLASGASAQLAQLTIEARRGTLQLRLARLDHSVPGYLIFWGTDANSTQEIGCRISDRTLVKNGTTMAFITAQFNLNRQSNYICRDVLGPKSNGIRLLFEARAFSERH